MRLYFLVEVDTADRTEPASIDSHDVRSAVEAELDRALSPEVTQAVHATQLPERAGRMLAEELTAPVAGIDLPLSDAEASRAARAAGGGLMPLGPTSDTADVPPPA